MSDSERSSDHDDEVAEDLDLAGCAEAPQLAWRAPRHQRAYEIVGADDVGPHSAREGT